MIFFDLFIHFFMIGLFTFGGGYSSVPLIEEYAVNTRGYITADELSSIFSIAKITPGPFCINCATFVGTKIAGIPGAVVATFSFALPSIIIVMVLAYLYMKYRNSLAMKNIFLVMNSCIVASLAGTAINIIVNSLLVNGKASITLPNIDIGGVILFGISCIALKFFKLSPTFVILGTAIAGIFIYR